MRLLKEDEEADVEVNYEDQQKINTFSRLNARLNDMEDTYETKKTELEYLEDLETELELADEEEPVMYRVGDAYISLGLEDAQKRLSKEQDGLKKEVGQLKTEMDDISDQMDKLKVILYAKFGKSINLEKD
ncbi:hypothetical protein K7432_007486 [Basidiobolus ranarum]|uniref:Prefoldin subunit 4 n=1 Tax=Basidiobolus ranarum TaxID=34480 RepID=A0ABR2WTA0_9FUNG